MSLPPSINDAVATLSRGSLRKPDMNTFKANLLRPNEEGEAVMAASHLAALDHLYNHLATYYETKGREGISKLIVSMPRRYGKSLTTAIFGAYFLGRNPDARLIVASFGEDLAKNLSRDIRGFITHPNFPFDVNIDPQSRAVLAWDLEDQRGGLTGHGIEAGATGLGFSCLLIDDILRNRSDSESELRRTRIWDELRNSFLNGADFPWSIVAVIGTRWHTDDPISRALNLWGDECHRLVLPFLIEEEQVEFDHLGNEIYRRQPDDPLWEYKHTLKAAHKVRDKEAPYDFASLYQQEPADKLGTFFLREWFAPVVAPREVPEIEYAVRGWDLAYIDSKTADWTVGVKIGVGADGRFYVLDVKRAKMDHYGRDLEKFLVDTFEEDGQDVAQVIEEGYIATEFIAQLNASPALMGYFITGYKTESKKKHERALPLQAKFNSGVLRLVVGDWNMDYVDEMCGYVPDVDSGHDDQVDASAISWAALETHSANWGWNSWS